MIIRELLLEKKKVYQEEPGGTFTDNGTDYDLNAALKLTADQPIAYFKVKDLQWLLKAAKLDGDKSRVESSNMNAPLLVGYYKTKWVVLDGLHRLAHAVEEKIEELPGKILTPEQLKSIEVKL